MDEAEKVNAAITGLRTSYVTRQDRAEIAALFGEATARQVDEVVGEAMRPPEDWGPPARSMETGLGAMHARLRARYPWLDGTASKQLNSMFIMTWK